MGNLAMKIKHLVYRTGLGFLRQCWRIFGRRVTVFDLLIKLSPDTIFPSYWNLRLPAGGVRSKIVRYGDFVQMHSMVAYVEQLQRSAVIIDVGAHHGAYAIVLGKILEKNNIQGKIIAVEPNPVSFDVLEKNVKLNGLENTIYCERVAVSDRAGEMNISLLDVQSGISNKATPETVPVNVVTLDMLMNKYGIDFVDVLQIDVEGAELPVLRGFPWEKATTAMIFCEMHPYAWADFNYSGNDFSELLVKRKLRCFDMYFREYNEFNRLAYLGPTLLIGGKYN